MSANVLGRVVNTKDQPRGPDAQMNVEIPSDWIVEGATLEIELPRNLACALCGGGGCDGCGRSGAISLRGRSDPKETVEVTLPKVAANDGAPPPSRGIVVRIPERGGPAPSASELPRGNLMLTIGVGESPSVGVTRLPGPSVPPPPVTPEFLPLEGAKAQDARAVWLLVAAVAAALAAWFLHR